MKRRAMQIIIFLFLGAIVNVAVAWGINLNVDLATYFTDLDYVEPLRSREVGSSWMYLKRGDRDYHMWGVVKVQKIASCYVHSAWDDLGSRMPSVGGSRVFMFKDPADLLPAWLSHLHPQQRPSIGKSHAMHAWGFGWPCYTLGGYTYVRPDNSGSLHERPYMPAEHYEFHSAFPQAASLPNMYLHWDDLKLIVYHPIWPGFALNTLFYALILALLWFTPITLRRWRRVRTGRCPNCAYDLQHETVAGCPECGWNR